MTRPLDFENYGGILFPMEEFVGNGAGDEGITGSFGWGSSPSITYPYMVEWNNWRLGTVLTQTLGLSAVNAYNLSRTLPMQHPVLPTYRCTSLSNIKPLKWTGKDDDGSGSFSVYDRVQLQLTFAPPPFAMMPDSSLATTYPFGGTVGDTGTLTAGSTTITGLAAGTMPQLAVGQLVKSTNNLPAFTTIVSINIAGTSIVVSNAALTTGGKILQFQGSTGKEQFRFCWWQEKPHLEIAQREGFQFTYTEYNGVGGQTGGPPDNKTPVKGFASVPKKTKTVTADWRFLPVSYIRNSSLNPSNLDAAHGSVNSTSFATPIGTFAPGTCLLRQYEITPEASPLQIPGLLPWQAQVLWRVNLIFEIFDTTLLKNPTITNPVQGHNCLWFPDGYWYACTSVQAGGAAASAPPFRSVDHQIIFQAAQ